MLYSVYNVSTKRYDYYEGSGPSGTHAGKPPISAAYKLGASPEGAAWKLPMDARKVGAGDLPKGRIASSGAAALGGIIDGSPLKLGALALAAYLAWRYLR